MRYLILAILLTPGLASADSLAVHCDPASVEIDNAVRGPLFEELKATKSELDSWPLRDRLWQEFTKAPDAHAQDLLDRGMRYIRIGAPDAAEPLLAQLIEYCPGYAEGWNQRAFARFLQGDYDAALEDIDKALEIEPRHFGALAGKVLTLVRQGRQGLALEALRKGLEVHPWMPERHMLPEGEKI